MDAYGPPLTEPLTPQEKRLMNEVIFLHYLWQQGPPTSPFLHPNPNLHPPNPSRNLGASTQRNKRRKWNPDDQQTGPAPQWPVDPPPPPVHDSPKLSDADNHETATKLAAMQLQQKAAKGFKEFLDRRRVDSNPGLDHGEQGEAEDEQEGEPLGSATDVQVSEEFNFLLSLFVEDPELRQLYETNQENGELYCIVCEGMGVKAGRTFKGCATLVHHAMQITKTKRQRSHRAFAHVIFRVFGWDLSRYPAIVVKDEPLSRSLQNSGATQGAQMSQVSDAEWSAWDPHTNSVKTINSADQPVMLAEVQFVQKALDECKTFFRETSDSVSDDEDDDELDKKDDELNFFMKLFDEDSELSNYYKSNHEGGNFCCLVCCAIGKKGWRRFRGCLGLLNHAMAISKTKRKRAHRAFVQVVCKVLDWDFNRLPTIVSSAECPPEETMATSSNLLCDPDELADLSTESFHDPSSKVESFSATNGELTCELNSNAHQNQSIQMTCKTCLVEDDAAEDLSAETEKKQKQATDLEIIHLLTDRKDKGLDGDEVNNVVGRG